MYKKHNHYQPPYSGSTVGIGIYSDNAGQKQRPPQQKKPEASKPQEPAKKDEDLEEKLDVLDEEDEDLISEILGDQAARNFRLQTDGQ